MYDAGSTAKYSLTTKLKSQRTFTALQQFDMER